MVKINQDAKEKLVRTLSHYESKCQSLEHDINLLKDSLVSLMSNQEGQGSQLNLDDLSEKTVDDVVDSLSNLLNFPAKGVMGDNEKYIVLSQLLIKLLDELPIPRELEQGAKTIRDTLCDAQSIDPLTKGIRELSNLVLSILNADKDRITAFINQYSEHLERVGEFVNNSKSSGEESLNDIAQLERGIKSNVSSMKTQIESSDNVGDLVSSLGGHLDTINTQVGDFKVIAENRVYDAEKQINSLKSQLSEMEKLNKNLEESLSSQFKIARHDPLTGLPNRMYYSEFIQQAVKRANRSGNPLSIAVVDIDYFKKVNDDYGHLVGDDVLKITATLLNKSIREVDFCARYGGEEFVIVLENCSKSDAVKRLEHIRGGVEEHQMTSGVKTLNVTISIGVTERANGEPVNTTFERADKALYEAKENGRNRVISL